jgi:hypothetical protein
MKIHMTKLAFKGLAAALALTAPGLGWAADHILSLTGISTSVCPSPGVTQSQAAVVSGTSGQVSTTPLILSGLQGNAASCSSNNINDNVSFTGTLTLEKATVKLCKPGTKGNLEWLDQGLAIVGVNGTLNASVGTGGSGVTYQVAIPAGNISVQNVSGSCSQLGQSNFTVTRAATTISKNNTTTLATASVVTGPAGGIPTIPEPGTLSLIGLGLAGLGWMASKRARKARVSAV